MKYRGVFAALFGASVLASAVAAPQAVAAAACQWTVQDLPVPDGALEPKTRGIADNGLIVGEVYHRGVRGVIWANGVPRLMAEPAAATTGVRPAEINNAGTVVGTQDIQSGNELLSRAFRYQDGVYHALYTEPQEQSRAVGVNDNGDVIGEVWLRSAPETRWVAMWPHDGNRRIYNKGQAIGISAGRKLVIAATTDKVWVIDGNNGGWTALPGARTPMVFDNERILHFEFGPTTTHIGEWNVAGQRIGTYVEGRDIYGKNAAGAVFGVSTHGQTSVWSGGTRTAVDADKLPHYSYAADIADDGSLIGTYQDSLSGLPHAARWTCA